MRTTKDRWRKDSIKSKNSSRTLCYKSWAIGIEAKRHSPIPTTWIKARAFSDSQNLRGNLFLRTEHWALSRITKAMYPEWVGLTQCPTPLRKIRKNKTNPNYNRPRLLSKCPKIGITLAMKIRNLRRRENWPNNDYFNSSLNIMMKMRPWDSLKTNPTSRLSPVKERKTNLIFSWKNKQTNLKINTQIIETRKKALKIAIRSGAKLCKNKLSYHRKTTSPYFWP